MLSAEEIREFEQQGFLGPFTLPAELLLEFGAPFRRRVEHVLLGPGSRLLPTFVYRNQHVYSRSVLRLVTLAPILSRVRSLLGPDVLLWTAHVIARPGGQQGQRWHSDPINQFVRGIHVSIALSDMNRQTGCLRVVPGSHLYRASLSRRPALAGAEDPTAFADQIAPWHAPHTVLDLELAAGQFFLAWGGLWHSVHPNRSAAPRLACVARYARTDVRCRAYGYDDSTIEHGSRLPCVLVSGQDGFGLNRLERPTSDLFADPLTLPTRLGWVQKELCGRARDLGPALGGRRSRGR